MWSEDRHYSSNSDPILKIENNSFGELQYLALEHFLLVTVDRLVFWRTPTADLYSRKTKLVFIIIGLSN